MTKENYNFIQSKKPGNLYSYYDEDNATSLHIIKSGWTDKYNCVMEWAFYETVEIDLYTAEEIKNLYGISTFLRKERKEKLNNINESKLQK